MLRHAADIFTSNIKVLYLLLYLFSIIEEHVSSGEARWVTYHIPEYTVDSVIQKVLPTWMPEIIGENNQSAWLHHASH